MPSLAVAAACAAALTATPVRAEKMTYLTAAPPSTPAFAPYQVAAFRGYYRDAGLEVEFVTGKGGADVAKQVGAGNADLGGGVGDTPIIVRANGVPIRGVALMGGSALAQIFARKDAGIATPADLRGKTVTVVSFQDTTFYSLLGVLAKFGMTQSDVDTEAVGQAAMVQLMLAGKAAALAGVPERGVTLDEAGLPTVLFPVNDYFPGMAQAVLASDDKIKRDPSLVRRFVGATLRGYRAVIADPVQATKDFIAATPENAGKEHEIETVLRTYVARVYPGQKVFGRFDPERVKAVQDFYFKSGIIERETPVDDLYTNDFVGGSDGTDDPKR